MARALIFLLAFLLAFWCCISLAVNIDVQNFGAKPDGQTDSTRAFLRAWNLACATTESATIHVPRGKYLLGAITFDGQVCKNRAITLRIDGTIVAPSDYNVIVNSANWIYFLRVTGISIVGGTLDARGADLWACKKSGQHCPPGATTLAFYQSSNIKIHGLTSMNSQMFNIVVYGCRKANIEAVTVSSPGDSPNTDGIHVQESLGVTITNTKIGTGDDCISIGTGTSNLWIERLACGPGHGISIGSLGQGTHEGVQNVTVKSVRFTGTENGVRVKTWATQNNGFVRNINFMNIVMDNVQNPIIIDQNYCPRNKNCPTQVSGVQIRDITFEHIQGTSATEIAMKFDCSRRRPCNGIALRDINLTYNKNQHAQDAKSLCVHARGKVSGFFVPKNCLDN